jgi:hypothetical protein
MRDPLCQCPRSATFAGLQLNDFIRLAIDEKVARLRALRNGGLPAAPRVEPLPPRFGTRRKLLSVLVDARTFRQLNEMFAESNIRRSAYVRDAMLHEATFPSDRTEDPARGPRQHVFPVMLTDDEHVAITNAAATRGIKRSVFVRIAIANAVDRASTTPRGTSLPSRQAVEPDHSRPDTTLAQ